jgi:hypothetical protein
VKKKRVQLLCEWLTTTLERSILHNTMSSTKMQDNQTSNSKTDITTQSSLPEPKPPVSAYNWFLKHKRLELSKDNDTPPPEYMKMIAQMWKNLDPSHQQVRTLF